MRTRDAGRRLRTGALWMLALSLLALLPAGIATAGEIGTGDVSTEIPTETPTQVPTEASGGVVPPTEAPRPTEEPNNEGVAPGSVVLMLVTSDGGLVPGGTTACVGDVCQSLPGDTVSGFKWEFQRIKEGWHEVRVRTTSPYDGAISSVQVFPGQVSRLQVEINLVAPRDEPPPSQEGPRPPGDNPRLDTGGDSQDAEAPAGVSQFTAVTALPATGAGSAELPFTTVLLASLGGLTLLLALAIRRLRTH